MNTAASEPYQGPRSPKLVCLPGLKGNLAESDAGKEPAAATTQPAASSAEPRPKAVRDAKISGSLAPLREVVGSLSRAREGFCATGLARQRLLRQARRAGLSALPALLRALGAESSHEAAWAHCLLRAIAAPGKRQQLRERVLQRLNQLLKSPRHADSVKARAMALLADLGAPLGDEVVLQDPDALLAGSVRELLSSLDSAADLEQALDLIFSQVPVAELRQFLDEVAHHGGALARPLFSALIADPRLPAEVARHLMAQYRPTRLPPRAAPVRRSRPAGERMLTRLARALNLLGEGKLTQARSRLTRLLPEFPDQPAVHSALGLCLLRLGEPHEAMAPLQRALELEPAVAAHAWNLAAAAQAAQRLGTCYRSLRRYLEQPDDSEGAASRRRTAELFCRSYSPRAPKTDEAPQAGTAQAGLGEE